MGVRATSGDDAGGDVAVFKADTGDVVAGSASRGGCEVASGFVVAGERLIVQACCRSLDLRTDCKVRR